MRVPVETDERTEVLQEEIVSLAEDIMEIDDQLDDITEVESGIIDGCIKLCDVVKRTNERLDTTKEQLYVVNDRLNCHMEEMEDKDTVIKIVIMILVVFFLVWNLILTYRISCYGI